MRIFSNTGRRTKQSKSLQTYHLPSVSGRYYPISINKDYVIKILNDLPIDDDIDVLINDEITYISFEFYRMVSDLITLDIKYGSINKDDILEVFEYSTFEITNQENCPLFEYIDLNQRYKLEYDKRENNEVMLDQRLKDVQLQNTEEKNTFLYKLFEKINMKNNVQQMKKNNKSILSMIKNYLGK